MVGGVEADSEAKQDFLTPTAEKHEISKLDFNFLFFFFFNFQEEKKKKWKKKKKEAPDLSQHKSLSFLIFSY